MEPEKETVGCVLCQVDDAEPVLKLHDFAFDIPGEFNLVRCRRCSLHYLNPRPSPSRIGQYYPDSYAPYKYAIEDESWTLMRWARRRNIRQYRRIVEQHSSRVPGRVLDIGCSTGIFLAEMQGAGWEAFGIDISPTAVAYARQRFGLQVSLGQLSEMKLDPSQFTAATLWDVLEHTYNPLQTLRTIHHLLETDGMVAISVPHFESWDRVIFGQYWIGFDAPRHLYAFPREVLARLVSEAGFDIVHVQCAFGGYYTSVASLRLWLNQRVRHPTVRGLASRLTSVPGVRFLFSPWDTLVDRMGRGNKLTIIARKASA